MLEFLKSNGRGQDRAADADNDVPARGRPTIGLALGGGAARGFAHIGVIRTLATKGIKPDVICGTSIGAVVGGCYATERLDLFEEWARSLSPRRVLGYLDISLSGSGLIGGSRLAALLAETLGKTSIEELPVRFAAIATELGTGHEIWLTRGRLADALRASYSLPGIFAPVRVGGRWLVDGALTNPVPVAAGHLDDRLDAGGAHDDRRWDRRHRDHRAIAVGDVHRVDAALERVGTAPDHRRAGALWWIELRRDHELAASQQLGERAQ